jgi:hypothetical protein
MCRTDTRVLDRGLTGKADQLRSCVGRVFFNPPSRAKWRVKENPPFGLLRSDYISRARPETRMLAPGAEGIWA